MGKAMLNPQEPPTISEEKKFTAQISLFTAKIIQTSMLYKSVEDFFYYLVTKSTSDNVIEVIESDDTFTFGRFTKTHIETSSKPFTNTTPKEFQIEKFGYFAYDSNSSLLSVLNNRELSLETCVSSIIKPLNLNSLIEFAPFSHDIKKTLKQFPVLSLSISYKDENANNAFSKLCNIDKGLFSKVALKGTLNKPTFITKIVEHFETVFNPEEYRINLQASEEKELIVNMIKNTITVKKTITLEKNDEANYALIKDMLIKLILENASS